MDWAKTLAQAPFNLAASGVAPYPLRDLGATLEDIELSGPSAYGYEPLQRALAAKCGVPVESVVAAVGTSLANHLAMAAVVEPGDEVLLEHPVYEPLLSLARYLGTRVNRFDRRPEAAYRIEPEQVRRKITARTRLIVLSNLHNPSGALTDEATMKEVGEIARGVGARILVDEVYLEMVWGRGSGQSRRPARSAFHLGKEFIATSSLTKAYGLNGLRCGWILAEPELARRIWRLNDLFVVIPAHAAERLSVVALQHLERIADRARASLERNRALLDRFLDSRHDLQAPRPGFGTIVFPRWSGGDVERLCVLLRDKYEVTVVPGKFFGMPDHFRIGIGGETEVLKAGLGRLAAALDDLTPA
jgi:aspartate/methionine/tyrosine aminotransferase